MTPSYGCIVLTQNQRPDDLRRAVDSLLVQKGVEVDIVVVGNACDPEGLPPTVRRLALSENVGAPAGRNAGVPHVRGELLVFLDDDASLPADDTLERIAKMFAMDAVLGAVQPRLADPSGHPPPRWWVPRVGAGDPARSSEATVLAEAAAVFRRSAFDQAGGWPERFFYYAEGSDLAWRLQDAGYTIWYAGDVVAHHPVPLIPGKKSRYLAARNRVWLARRNLPLPIAAVYVTGWFVRMAGTSRSVRDAQNLLRGYRDGFREPAGDRRPLRWRTIWRMTRAGRPPIV